MNKPAHTAPPTRGPSDHDVRTQIVAAATEYFARYGYEKTTVSDLAKEIGFSKAYIYKFFDSKQAIGEVICTNRLDDMRRAVDAAIVDAASASDRFRRMFRAFVDAGTQLFFGDRKLYDIAATAALEPWPSVRAYERYVEELVVRIVREGRESGEFERKTPLDETANAICLVMKPYISPLLLQYNLDGAQDATVHLSNLVLRSLAP
ncbi:TetR/AcrR family transcriptional regulator [Massilia sp. Root335]|uniref:TetR/AcrR family transcriptional regulator n=1 Tax=Massilia sp. Root335 TaxID=1736517 RepID=UPI000700B2FA|nr:TetR/AcrR family transcriptional regulator [Massilia sp. Root335]KQV52108.1 AcrR family transcriptional regulator [Massilia sp. Root335]